MADLTSMTVTNDVSFSHCTVFLTIGYDVLKIRMPSPENNLRLRSTVLTAVLQKESGSSKIDDETAHDESQLHTLVPR
jgi:hypothetical protein